MSLINISFFCFLNVLTISAATRKHLRDGFKDNHIQKREVCPLGQYYDHGTGHCDPCKPHCRWRLHASPADCKDFCGELSTESPQTKQRAKEPPDFPSSVCRNGSYHDDVTGHCDPCKPHCDRIPLEEPPDGCKTFCRKSALSRKSTGIEGLSVGIIVAITVGSILGLTALVCLIVIARRKLKRHHRQEVNLNVNAHVEEEFKPGVPEETPVHGILM